MTAGSLNTMADAIATAITTPPQPATNPEPVPAVTLTPEDMDRIVAAVADRVLIVTKEVLTLDEASRYMGITKSQMYKLTSERAVPYSKPAGKMCYFSREALDEWLMSRPVATAGDINTRAVTYCMTHKTDLSPKIRRNKWN